MARLGSITKQSLILAVLLIMPLASSAAAAAPAYREGFVYAEGERLMLDGAPFVMKGFNYCPRDYGWTSMADWDWEAVDRELALAASLNANTIRTGINFQYATGNIDGQHGPTRPVVAASALGRRRQLRGV